MPEAIGMAITGLIGLSVSAPMEVAIGSFVITMGMSVVMSAASKLLMRGPSGANFSQDSANRTMNVKQPIAPRRVVYGRAQLGGVVTHISVTGDKREYRNIVYTLAGHKLHSIGQVYVDGVPVSLDADGNALEKYAGFITVKKSLGDPSDATQPFPDLVTDTFGLDESSRWDENHLQRGCAKVWIKFKLDQNVMPNGIPTVTFLVQGREVYDPRTGTVGYSENSALCLRDYVRDLPYGLNARADEINEDLAIAAANVCDEDVTLAAGGIEKRYTCNGTFECSQLRKDTLGGLLSSMAGDLVYTSGQWCIYAGAWRGSSLSLTDSDLTGSVKYDARASKRDLCNGVKGVYVSPNNAWQPTDFPAVTNAAYVAEDGGDDIWLDIELPYTISCPTAQRLAKIQLESKRRQGALQLPAKLSAYQLQPPDIFEFTHPNFGWQAKTFKALSQSWIPGQDANNNPIVTTGIVGQEIDSHVYDWDPVTDEKLPNPGDIPIFPSATPDPPSGLVLTSGDATALIRVDGIRISRIKVAWTLPNDQSVLSGGMIRVQYRKTGDLTWIESLPSDGSGTFSFITGVNDGVSYDVRICSQNKSNTISAWVSGTHVVQPVAFPHASYRPKSNPLRAVDGGSFPIVYIDDFLMAVSGLPDISLSGGSINATSGDYGRTAFIFYDDPTFAGGAVTYNMTFIRETALGGTCRFFVGSIALPVAGGSPTVGNGDGGAGGQYSRSATLLPSVYAAAGWNNPSNAIDTNPDNYADATTSGSTLTFEASGYAASGGLFGQLVLRVKHQLLSGGAILEYTRDNGVNWQELRTASGADTDPVSSEIELPAGQRTELVRARMSLLASSSGGRSTAAATVAGNDAGIGTLAWTTGAGSGSVSGVGTTNFLKLTNLGLAIPSGVVLDGIAVQVTRSGSLLDEMAWMGPLTGYVHLIENVSDAAVCIVKGGVIKTADRSARGSFWSPSPQDVNYGSSLDLWGETWTDVDINDPGFGIAIAAVLNALNATPGASILSVRVTVYYSTGGGSGSSGRIFHFPQEVTF